MVASALVMVAMLSVGDSLAEAQQAFTEGRYEEAERLALEAEQSSQPGAALYLVGLARFRAGRPAEALEALDAAGQAPDAPEHASWSFNRGACLYALERFDEAEEAFREATVDESLRRIAAVNAGFAALDAGSHERAAQWAARAREGASERELAQVEELLAELARAQGQAADASADAYREGLASFDAGRFDEAREHFLQAAKQEPSSGRARLMAGASAWRTGNRAVAREDLTSALALQLEPTDQETARDYLDRLSLGLRANGRGSGASVDVSTGFDSNVLQVGVAPRDSFTGTSVGTGSAFTEVGLGFVSRLRPSDTLFAELSYSGSQRTYAQSSARDYSLQLHRVEAAAELEAAPRFRLGASAGGDMFFTGMSALRGLQASAGGAVWLVLDESELTSTRLGASFTRKIGLSEFSYLTGRRLDATLSQEFRLGSASATAWYRYREDRLGTLVQTVSGGLQSGVSQEYVIPYAWAGHATGASARLLLNEGWEAGLDAGVEWRRYLGESFLRFQTVDGLEEERGRRRRRDVRFVVGPALSVPLTKHLVLTGRYDLLVNTSNVDTRLNTTPEACMLPDSSSCHRFDYTNGNYQKHLGMLELSATW